MELAYHKAYGMAAVAVVAVVADGIWFKILTPGFAAHLRTVQYHTSGAPTTYIKLYIRNRILINVPYVGTVWCLGSFGSDL